MATYNRYKSFVTENGNMRTIPFIKIPKRNSDKYTYWDRYNSRMDLLSYQFYGDPNYGWLILQANPHLPSLEFLIPNGEKIRIPFPLEVSISQYESDIKSYYIVENSD